MMEFLIFIVIVVVVWFIVKPKNEVIQPQLSNSMTDEKRSAFKEINHTVNQILTDNFVVLDTETTGLGENDQIIEICILDIYGSRLLDTYVKPKRKMGQNNKAVEVHGITDEILENAPTWDEIHQQVCEILQGKMVLAYNAPFDLRLLEQTMKKYDLSMPDCTFECAMNVYTAYRMVENNEEPRRYKLIDACRHLYVIPFGQEHRAYTDCMMTLDLIKAIEKNTRLSIYYR